MAVLKHRALVGCSWRDARKPAHQGKMLGMQTNFEMAVDDASHASPQRHRFGHLIGGVFRQWRRQMDLSFKGLGLSDASRMPLLVMYVHGRPMRQKDLAQALYLDTSSLVRVLAQLRAAKLVDWSVDPADRRAKCIALTEQGRQAAAQILKASLEIEQAILADLTPQELETTRNVLQKISQRFDAWQ